MKSDGLSSFNSESNKIHSREKLKHKSPFPKPKEKEKETLAIGELQETIQRLLQNSLQDHKKQEQDALSVSALPSIPLFNPQFSELLQVQASAEITQLFNEMVGFIAECTDSDIQRTTFFLDSPEFSHSIFYGAKITIVEYSTAPKIFNIELSATPEALAVFQASAADFMAAFQNGKFDFQINRIETHFSEEQLAGKRKIPPVSKEKDQDL